LRIGGLRSDLHNSRLAAYRAASRERLLLELLDHAIEIGIAGVPTALGNPLAISDNLELAGLPRFIAGFNIEALLDEGHETRDLGLVVLSCRAVNVV
jgi:hypothetical protein